MNDRDVGRLLARLDDPRPLPDRLRRDLLTAIRGDELGLAGSDGPRPLPDDVRRRIESSLLITPARPDGRLMRQRLLAVAAVLVALVGLLAVVSRQPGDGSTKVAGPRSSATTGVSPAGERGAGGTGGGGSTRGSASGGAIGSASGVPFAQGGTTSSGETASDAPAAAGSAAAPAGGGGVGGSPPVHVAVVGRDPDIAAGFDAYLRTLNGSGGIGGRPLVAVARGDARAVATVNVAALPSAEPVGGVLFETVYVDEPRLRGSVVSLASPLERQARLAVAEAFPEPARGARAAVYTSSAEPWANVVPAALEAALRERGVTAVRVPFPAPTSIPVDAAFLSLSPEDARSWVAAASSTPAKGVWGVASAWDDRLARAGERLSLRVLSPYTPVGGDEEAALRRGLPDGAALSAGAVHGWVTAKALAVLLTTNGGQQVHETDLDRLAGWEPAWAPPFEVRPRTRARTPDALLLRPVDGRFVPVGDFRRG